MKIALIQQTATQDRSANLEKGLAAARQAASEGAELIAFAELAFEPFYPQKRASGDPAELAEPVPGPVTEAFQEAAAQLGVVVVLNLFERDGDGLGCWLGLGIQFLKEMGRMMKSHMYVRRGTKSAPVVHDRPQDGFLAEGYR